MRKLITISINTLKGFSSPVFNFLIAILGIKYFGKEDWGILINVMLWIFFISFIINWGNREYLIRKYTQQPSRLHYIFYSSFLIRSIFLTFSGVLFFFFPFTTALYATILVVLIHCYSSMDSVVVYHQRFGEQLLAETVGFLIIISVIFYYNTFDLVIFLQAYIIANSIKIIILASNLKLYRKDFSYYVSFIEIKQGFPFFLIGFSGWLQSKIDLYIVSVFLTKTRLSEYQLLITAFLMLQAVSGFIVIPFMKHIFRMPQNNIKKLKTLLALFSFPIVITGTLIIRFILERVVNLDINYEIYLLGGLSSIPSFLYMIHIMELYKTGKEKRVMAINFMGAFVNLITILCLIYYYDITGVFIGVCITQWLILILYKTYGRTSMPSLQI
ncbi:lipopolysaccharide biosynthesis protein [Aquimarina sp. RZ0]|uniref:lipopolysaccharide biosynthesis protein n=1 Tax=Aquimarina sp. RZ0 TaxID=2607730 RepID=UPI0011F35E49|nr:hypothetical protein [Aquimarina sp. RZ0]KAA1244140.1 hypothetical protein F0000_17830 [Aquimarina sp. RZ0]